MPTLAEDFDPAVYTTPPRFDASGGVALGSALLSAVPKNASPKVKKAAAALRASTVGLQSSWALHDVVVKKRDARPADLALDVAWGSLHGRLECYGRLPDERHPRAARARELDELLFPGGSTAFLNLSYEAEWAESNKRVTRIDAEKLAHDLDALAGSEFLAEIRRSHKVYGEVLEITRAADPEVVIPNLTEGIRALARSMTSYALQVIAAADLDDAKDLQQVKSALQPLVTFRPVSTSRPGQPPTPAATPTSVVPDAPK